MRSLPFALALALLAGCGGDESGVEVAEDPGSASSATAAPESASERPRIDKGQGLELEVLVEGAGVALRRDHDVKVHYRGYFEDGDVEFDSSYSRHQPYPFTLGRGNVLKGWHKGLEGVRVGSKVILHVPAALAYGEKGNPAAMIPPNQDLKFWFHVLEAR